MIPSIGCHSLVTLMAPDASRVMSSRLRTRRLSRWPLRGSSRRGHARAAAVERRLRLEERAGGPGDDRERRAKIVRDGAEKRAPEPLGLDLDLGLLRLLGEARALERRRNLVGEDVEQRALLGVGEAVRIVRRDAEHADVALRSPREASRARAPKEACRCPSPAGLSCDQTHSATPRSFSSGANELLACGDVLELARRRLSSKRATFASKTSWTCCDGDRRQVAGRAGGRELAAHAVEARGAPLAIRAPRRPGGGRGASGC